MDAMVQQRKKQLRILNNVLRYRTAILSTFMFRPTVCLMRDMLVTMMDHDILNESTMYSLFHQKKNKKKLKRIANKVLDFITNYLDKSTDWEKFSVCVDILMQTVFTGIGYATLKLSKIKSR